MGRSNIPITLLTRQTTIEDDDIIPFGLKQGSNARRGGTARGIKVSDLEKKFEDNGLAQIIREISSSDQILITDDIIFAVGNITLTFASVSLMEKQITIRNISGTTTLAPSGSDTSEVLLLTTGGSTTLAPRQSASALLQI